MSVAWPTGVQLVKTSFTSDFQWCCLAVQESPTVTEHVVSVSLLSVIYLFYRDDSLTS